MRALWNSLADRWVALWHRLTHCTRYGHYKTYRGRCLNCGARVRPGRGDRRTPDGRG